MEEDQSRSADVHRPLNNEQRRETDKGREKW